jgi:hypothetical protein
MGGTSFLPLFFGSSMTKQEQLQTYGKVVIDALSPIVKWQYNDFHGVMLAEFSVDKQDQVRLALQQVLPLSWDAKSIKKAPSELKHKAHFFAKLSKNQMLLSDHLENQPKIMVAWWPWGHGATVSIRVFLTSTAPYQEKSGLFQRLTGIFS